LVRVGTPVDEPHALCAQQFLDGLRRGWQARAGGLPAVADLPATVEDAMNVWCWTPNDGFTLALPSTGSPTRARTAEPANRGNQPAYSTLGFGERWAASGFSCVSRKSGLTCSNADGHGWTLPRYRGLPAYF
jgi:hypothetical protein